MCTYFPIPVFRPGRSHRQGRLVGSSPRCSETVKHDLVTKQQQNFPILLT